MISLASALPIGNAVRLVLAPASDALRTRVVRKATNDISGPTDGTIIYEGSELVAVDFSDLTNGIEVFYQAFDWNGSTWESSVSVGVTPAASASLEGPDPLSLVRDRLALGLAQEVKNGALAPKSGSIAVLTAPPIWDQTPMPVVSVHLKDDRPSVRAIGENVGQDEFDDTADKWDVSEGWVGGTQLDIIGWCLNPDERIALRIALKKIMIGNLPIFEAAGLSHVEISQNDIEDFESYATPVYQTLCPFTCMASAAVVSTADPITDATAVVTSPT